MKRTLYDIGSDLIALNDLLEELGGDVTDEQVETAFEAWFAEVESDLKTKLDGYVMLMAELGHMAEIRRAEAARLFKLAQANENSVERLKARLKQFFERTGRTKEETDHFKITLAKNGGKLPLHINPDIYGNLEVLPEEFKKVSFDLDKDAVRAALERGEELKFAEFGVRGTSLRIK